MTNIILQSCFIFLWGSAFIAAKFGLADAGPFSMLLTRFFIVTIIFILLVIVFRNSWPKFNQISHLFLVGLLLHGFYLGGVFYAISVGTPAGISSLIVSLHPALTCVFAIILTSEKIRIDQWIGVILGIIGVYIVTWPKLGGEIPIIGFISCVIALTGISYATIHQKKYLSDMNILSGNAFQAFAACIFFLLVISFIEPYKFNLSLNLLLSMLYLIFPVSIGAISILMILIRRGEIAKTASLFFLCPLVTAFLGFVIFDEKLGLVGLIGFCITSSGVWLVNRTLNLKT
tara:strand:- start:266 stop:1129 length:864 start_codon:yes stop_codon:yes gene_type:complete